MGECGKNQLDNGFWSPYYYIWAINMYKWPYICYFCGYFFCYLNYYGVRKKVKSYLIMIISWYGKVNENLKVKKN